MSATQRWTILQPAEPHERFARNSWDGLIGTRVPVAFSGRTVEAVLVAAVVAEDGTSAELTFEAEIPPPEEREPLRLVTTWDGNCLTVTCDAEWR